MAKAKKSEKEPDEKVDIVALWTIVRKIVRVLENVFGVDLDNDGKVGRARVAVLVSMIVACAFIGAVIGEQQDAEWVLDDNCYYEESTGTLTVSNLTCTGTATLPAVSSTVSNLAATGTADVTGDATVGGTLDVTGDTTVSNLTATGTADVTGDATVGGTLDVTGDTTVSNLAATGTADVTGDATVGGTLDVTGDTTVSNLTATGTADVTGDATVGGTLDVTGDTTVSNLAATGTADVTGDATVGGTLDVTGDTTVSNLTATGTADVTGDATVGGTLDVTGAVTMDGGATVTGDVDSVETDGTWADGDMSCAGFIKGASVGADKIYLASDIYLTMVGTSFVIIDGAVTNTLDADTTESE